MSLKNLELIESEEDLIIMKKELTEKKKEIQLKINNNDENKQDYEKLMDITNKVIQKINKKIKK